MRAEFDCNYLKIQMKINQISNLLFRSSISPIRKCQANDSSRNQLENEGNSKFLTEPYDTKIYNSQSAEKNMGVKEKSIKKYYLNEKPVSAITRNNHKASNSLNMAQSTNTSVSTSQPKLKQANALSTSVNNKKSECVMVLPDIYQSSFVNISLNAPLKNRCNVCGKPNASNDRFPHVKCFGIECGNIYCSDCYQRNYFQIKPNTKCRFLECGQCGVKKTCIMSSIFCSACEKRICSSCHKANHADHGVAIKYY